MLPSGGLSSRGGRPPRPVPLGRWRRELPRGRLGSLGPGAWSPRNLWAAPGQDLGARRRRQVFPVGPEPKRVDGGGGGAERLAATTPELRGSPGGPAPGPALRPQLGCGPRGSPRPSADGGAGGRLAREGGRAGSGPPGPGSCAAAAPAGARCTELRQGATRARGHASRAPETTTPRPLGGRGRPAPPVGPLGGRRGAAVSRATRALGRRAGGGPAPYCVAAGAGPRGAGQVRAGALRGQGRPPAELGSPGARSKRGLGQRGFLWGAELEFWGLKWDF